MVPGWKSTGLDGLMASHMPAIEDIRCQIAGMIGQNRTKPDIKGGAIDK
jgi:hypothetical protein